MFKQIVLRVVVPVAVLASMSAQADAFHHRWARTACLKWGSPCLFYPGCNNGHGYLCCGSGHGSGCGAGWCCSRHYTTPCERARATCFLRTPLAHVVCWLGHHHWCHWHRHHGHGCGDCYADCGGDGCYSGGGCNSRTDGYTGGGSPDPSSHAPEGTVPGKTEVLYDGPAPAPAAEDGAEPVPGGEALLPRGVPYRLVSNIRRDGSAAFQQGLSSMRRGSLTEALRDFEAAANVEPSNAMYHYHRALVLFDLSGAEAGQEALAVAVRCEGSEPVQDWGKRMERVQGRSRVWVEKARREASLVR